MTCIRGLCVLNSKICVLALIYHFKRRTQLFQVETKHVQEEYKLPHMGKAHTLERLTKPHNLSQGPVAPHSPTAEPQVPGEPALSMFRSLSLLLSLSSCHGMESHISLECSSAESGEQLDFVPIIVFN